MIRSPNNIMCTACCRTMQYLYYSRGPSYAFAALSNTLFWYGTRCEQLRLCFEPWGRRNKKFEYPISRKPNHRKYTAVLCMILYVHHYKTLFFSLLLLYNNSSSSMALTAVRCNLSRCGLHTPPPRSYRPYLTPPAGLARVAKGRMMGVYPHCCCCFCCLGGHRVKASL